MTKEMLEQMLKAQPDVKLEGAQVTASEDTQLFLLISSANGPIPLGRIESAELGETFITLKGKEACWCLPYDQICGIKWSDRSGHKGPRAGFRS